MSAKLKVQATPKRGPENQRKPITIEVKAESQEEAERIVRAQCKDCTVGDPATASLDSLAITPRT